MPDDCLFCKMAAGDVPVDKLRDDDVLFAIRDIHPRTPTHVLIVPKEHIPSALVLDESHAPLLGHMFKSAAELAHELGIAEKGFRLAFNVGDYGSQTIYHLHLHLLGGRPLGPEG